MAAKENVATSALLSADQIADEIRRYCFAHPNARDSVEGIAWWLALQHYSEVKNSLMVSVDQLVTAGFLTKHRLTDGTDVFGCAGKGCADTSAPIARRTRSHK